MATVMFGDRLRALIVQRGFKFNRFARLLNVDEAAVSRWCATKGTRRYPFLPYAVQMSWLLGVPLETLVRNTELDPAYIVTLHPYARARVSRAKRQRERMAKARKGKGRKPAAVRAARAARARR